MYVFTVLSVCIIHIYIPFRHKASTQHIEDVSGGGESAIFREPISPVKPQQDNQTCRYPELSGYRNKRRHVLQNEDC